MIKFRQKEFSEYDAMRSLYVELMKSPEWRNRVSIIDSSALIPILRGNNIVIERFVINTSFFKKDRYRMYLKIGAKAKMPDDVRLPGRTYERNVGDFRVKIENGVTFPKAPEFKKEDNSEGGNNNKGKDKKQKNYSCLSQRVFANKNKNNNNNGGGKYISASFAPSLSLSYEVTELLGDAIRYDKPGRSLVLEFDTIFDAIRALNILPFGIGYKLYLLS